MQSKKVIIMNYKKILKQIAQENNVSTEYVENEMKKAISGAGYDIPVKLFVELCAISVKKTINSK